MSFGNRLKKILDEKKMSQKTLSELTGFSQAMVGRYIKKDGEPTGEFILNVLKIFPGNTNYLLFGEDSYFDIVNEANSSYGKSAVDIVNEIEDRIKQLKDKLSQK